MASIALHEVFGARLCAYVMDDQNVAANHIPDVLMREFLHRCSLRLATHPELRVAYERKYGLPFYLLPAVAPDRLIAREPTQPQKDIHVVDMHDKTGGKRGAMIGSFWDQSWFDRLCAALAPTGYSIDWFGNNRSPFVRFPKEQLLCAGSTRAELFPEDQLAAALREYPFVIVPTGTFDFSETNTPVTSLSLPGRIPFATAVSQTPILVVGSTGTCASRFVKHFGIGQTVGYDRRELKDAMDRLRDPKTQVDMRSNAARIAPAFSDRGVVEWLQESMELGRAADNRFEDAFEGYEVVGRTPGSQPTPPSAFERSRVAGRGGSGADEGVRPTLALRYGLHMSLLSSVKHILKMCGHALNITVHEQLSAAEVERQANATNVEFKIGKLMETDAGLLQASIHIIENLHALAGQTIVRTDVNCSGQPDAP